MIDIVLLTGTFAASIASLALNIYYVWQRLRMQKQLLEVEREKLRSRKVSPQ